MKQRITLLIIALVLLASPYSSMAQNLYSYGFDTVASSGLPARGWTTNVTAATCCADFHWMFGSPLTSYSYSTAYYGAGPTGTYAFWCPNPVTHSGSGMAMLNTFYEEGAGSWGSPGNSELASPAISLPSTGVTVVSYWLFLSPGYEGYFCPTCTGYNRDSVQIWVNTSASASGGTRLRKVIIDSSSSIVDGWYKYIDTIPSSYNGSNVNIIFKGWTTYYDFNSDINLDDVSVDHYFDCSAAAGGPHAGVISGPTHTCRNKTITLIDTGGTTYVGYAYQWQSRPSGTTTWTNIGGSYNPFNTSIATGQDNTDYRVYMTCSSTGYTDTSNVKTIAADSFFKCYCALPTTNTDIGGNTPPTIDSVAISGTTLKNITHTAYSGFYAQIADSVAKTQATVSRGGTYKLYVNYSGASTYGMAWIDWNQSGIFNDSAAAEYFTINSSLSGNGGITFTVPTTARLGRTGLRIRTTALYSPNASYACTNFGTGTGAGETADYIITVTDPPGIDLGVTNISAPPIGVTYCPNKPDTIIATIQNYGSTPQSNFYVYAVSNGPHKDAIYTLYTGTLAPLSTASIYIGTIDPPLGGSYSLQVFTAVSGDAVSFNDTMYSYYSLYPLPADPIVTSDTVCPGGTAHISVSPSPYQQMKWYRVPTGGTAFDSTSYTIAVASPGGDSIYYISATDSGTTCIGNRIPVTATMRPKPIVNLGNDSTLCESPKFMLDAGNHGGSKYLWNTGDTTEKINPRVSGTYSVNVFHYCTVTSSINLVIDPLPKADGIDYVRSANSYDYTVSGVLYTNSYKWYFGDGDSSTSPTPSHTYTTGGPYNVTVILYNSCGADTVTWGVPTKVKNLGQQNGNLSLYPNPANDRLILSAGNSTTITQVTVVNAIGTVVYSKDISNEKTLSIDVSMLPQGQYILRANTNQGINTKLFDVLHK